MVYVVKNLTLGKKSYRTKHKGESTSKGGPLKMKFSSCCKLNINATSG